MAVQAVGRSNKTVGGSLKGADGDYAAERREEAWRPVCALTRCGNGWLRSGQRKSIIRTHRRLAIGSDYIGLARFTQVEPGL